MVTSIPVSMNSADRQALAVADELAGLGPMALLSSPLARARETAQPLAERWHSDILIEPRVAEIPSPSKNLSARAAWLRQAMAGRWSDLGADLNALAPGPHRLRGGAAG